jgi:hypothetical protein
MTILLDRYTGTIGSTVESVAGPSISTPVSLNNAQINKTHGVTSLKTITFVAIKVRISYFLSERLL